MTGWKRLAASIAVGSFPAAIVLGFVLVPGYMLVAIAVLAIGLLCIILGAVAYDDLGK